MKYALTAAALCFGLLGAQAQNTKGQDVQSPKNCLTSTTDKDWTTLGLNAEQSAKVKELQAEWRANESAKTVNAKTDARSAPVMDSYEAKVKDVLTPEQYESWVKWCSTHANKAVKQKADHVTLPDGEHAE